MEKNKTFAEGISYYKVENEKATWVKANIYLKVAKLKEFMDKHIDDKGEVKLALKEGKTGNLYLELDTYRKSKEVVEDNMTSDGFNGEPAIDVTTINWD